MLKTVTTVKQDWKSNELANETTEMKKYLFGWNYKTIKTTINHLNHEARDNNSSGSIRGFSG